ncbi:hypothetical protein [Paenibacillus aceti]|uniref:Replication protein n=1 Tax=Paenibacillus aceti TaxID=1820010 RepID=A0ABQ1W0C5_9BACL|nr:hypothetical protein [Paenibacillus aceti]GGG08625.1 hypothetical protein GCM10010913_32990 [Paenibacillus aceti]
MAVDRMREQRYWMNLTPRTKRGILAQKDVIESEFGERLANFEVVLRTPESQVRGKKSLDEIRTHAEENGGFVFALFNGCMTMAERFPSLTQSDLARLMFIGTYTNYDGRLQYDNGRPINRKALEALLGMNRARFSELYQKLLIEEIVKDENEHGDIYINPSIFYRGKLGDAEYKLDDYRHTRLFRKTVRDLYERYNGRTIKQLAIVFAVLPFINFAFNVVCFNPEEIDEDRVKPMDLENLAALLNYKDTHKLRTALGALKLDGKPVFLLIPDVNDKRKRRIIVNPRIVFAGKAETLAGIKVLFN